MHADRNGTWGPHPGYALLPALAILGACGWLLSRNQEPIAPSGTAVTAMKPVEGSVAALGEMPIEVRYGVPTAATAYLWKAKQQLP